MKHKKSLHKKVSAKAHRSPKRQTNFFNEHTIIISAGIVTAFVLMVVALDRRTITQSVAGVSIMRGIYQEATFTLPQVPGAAGYNVYYKRDSDPVFANALRNIPITESTVTIGYLQRGANYVYKFSAYDTTGKEFYFSPVQEMINLQSM